MRICLTPQVHGVGGMVSFAAKFAQGLHRRGIETTTDLRSLAYDAILVIGGTRDLVGLWRARQHGIPIVQRLNGMNWVHRVRHTGLKHTLRAEYGNWLLSFIRGHLATRIVYQSRFSQRWWERVYGPTRNPHTVIYNGVDLAVYAPHGETEMAPAGVCRILMVEGNLGGGYEMGLETGISLAEQVAASTSRAVELMIVGRVSPGLQEHWRRRSRVPLRWAGQVGRERIPAMDRSADLFYAADLHPACPNAVIEALACGLPVVAFDTGALAEIVTPAAGRVVPYGSDPWKVEPPDVGALATGAVEVLEALPHFRAGARQRAEEAFGLEKMIEGYLQSLGAA